MKAVAKWALIVFPWMVLLCIGLLYVASHTVAPLSFPWVWREADRVPSPSGACELVIYEGNRGAMSSTAYVCFLLKPGDKADPDTCDPYQPVLSTSHSLPKVRWESEGLLILSCGGGYVTHQRPYSRDFKVAIEVRGSEMRRYQISLYEVKTGIVRDPQSLGVRHTGGQQSLFFDTEEEALAFKDEILNRFPDVEVVLRHESVESGGLRFFREGDRVVEETINKK